MPPNVNAVESDPIVGAVNGIVKSDGAGNISVAVEDTDYQSVPSEGAFADGDKSKLDGIENSATANPDALDNVVEDLSPELGGNLATNGKWISGDGDNEGIYIDM
jgi:hypothetical protein